MLDSLENLIKGAVDSSLLKSEKLRKPLDIKSISGRLKIICNSSARFYLRYEDLEKQLKLNNIEQVQRLAEILKIEATRIFNEVSNNRLGEDKTNEVIEYMLSEHYFKDIKQINIYK